MKNLAPVTLVIPSYNRCNLIVETIESALNQTLPFQEIVVVDDGSTDDTPSVLAQFGSRIKVIRTSNQGVQAARNTGIAYASTELVAMLDSDDLLEPDYLEQMATWMLAHPEQDAAYCNFVTFNSSKTDVDKISRSPFDFLDGSRNDGYFAYDIPNLYERSLRYQPLFTCGMIVRKRFFSIYGGYNPAFNRVGAEDWEYTLRLISEGRVAVCIKTLARVRKHEDNDSADHVHMSLGEAKILEYALTHHSTANILHNEINRSIQQRIVSAFGSAFDRKDLGLARIISKDIHSPLPMKIRVKILISNLPQILGSWAWTLIQKITGSQK